jgi:hypothetical protein
VRAIVRGRVRAEVRPGKAQITANTEVAAERRHDAVEIIPFDPDGFSSAGCARTVAALPEPKQTEEARSR